MLERAITIAAQAHEGQVQKDGTPYILHPLHVMIQLADEAAQMVAVLHDVVEDTEWSLSDLQAEGFDDDIVVAVGLLTKQKGMSYEQYIEDIAANDLARRVKLADLEHNMNILRIPDLRAQDLERIGRYHAAHARLRS